MPTPELPRKGEWRCLVRLKVLDLTRSVAVADPDSRRWNHSLSLAYEGGPGSPAPAEGLVGTSVAKQLVLQLLLRAKVCFKDHIIVKGLFVAPEARRPHRWERSSASRPAGTSSRTGLGEQDLGR